MKFCCKDRSLVNRVPTCEMMLQKYDFSNFKMMATLRAFLVYSRFFQKYKMGSSIFLIIRITDRNGKRKKEK